MSRKTVPAAFLALALVCASVAGQPPAELPVAQGVRFPQALTSAELRFSVDGDKILVVREYSGGIAPLVTVHDTQDRPVQGRGIYFSLGSPDVYSDKVSSGSRQFGGISAAFDPGGNLMVTTAYRTVRLWDISKGHRGLWPKPVSLELPNSVGAVFTKDGKQLITASLVTDANTGPKARFEVRPWDVAAGKWVADASTAAVPGRIVQPTLWALTLAPDESFFLTAAASNSQSDAKSVQFWDAKTLKPDGDPLPAAGSAFRIGPDGKTLLAVAQGETALWDLTTRKRRCVLATPEVIERWPSSAYNFRSRPWVAAMPNGTSVLYRRVDEVGLWDLTGEKPVEKLTLKHDGPVYWVAVSPDGKRAAVASVRPEEVIVWDLGTGKAVMKVPHVGSVEAMAFSPDGRLLATASPGDVHLWALDTKK